ncbi:MAG: cytochrome C [Sphingobacteriales bacterium]|nr:cytochrome C [Sphingobacteriales bacterium]MBI3720379.1 cytochrome C [Sphingobacteriales bacterium]
MKKLLLATALLVAVWSCTKKATPAKSETGSTTTAVATTTTEAKPSPSAELIAAGKTTYEAKCGRCHPLHATNQYAADKWVNLVNVMAPKAKLTDTEKDNVLTYVQAGAKQ